jgi:hypothetical protein
VIGFWIGNSLNITKIFPVRPDEFCVVLSGRGRLNDVPLQESAIKFLSYESSVS